MTVDLILLPPTTFTNLSYASLAIMARGHALTDDLRAVLIHMCKTLDVESILHHSGVPLRTLQRLLSDYRKHGTAARQKGPELRGRPRKLTPQHVRVSFMLLYRMIHQFMQD